jgi:solute carrier family 30 (zinc transporter), member 2
MSPRSIFGSMFEAPKAAFRCSDDTLTEISLDQSSDSKLSTTHCAQDKHSHPENKYRKNRLLIAVCICTLLFLLEFAGGMYTNSLAILADSFHMLTDVFGYTLSFLALYFSTIPKNNTFSYGYKRLEVVGAMASICLIWILSLGLMWEARECFNDPKPIKALPMLCMSIAGVLVNGVLIFVFGHEESHDYSDLETAHKDTEKRTHANDLNIRAAMLHAIGDLICSIGVVISAATIYINPSLHWVDPLCTLIFGIVALSTTLGIIRDIFGVIMQSTPPHIDLQTVNAEMAKIKGVTRSEAQLWSLTLDDVIADVKLEVPSYTTFAQSQDIVKRAKVLMENRFGVSKCTIEVYN